MALRKPFVWLYPETQERNCQRLFRRFLSELYLEFLRKLRERNLLRLDSPEETWSDDLELAAELAIAWWLLRIAEVKTELQKQFIAVSLFNDKQFRRVIRQLYGVHIPQSQTLGYDFGSQVSPHSQLRDVMGDAADIERIETYIDRIQSSFVASASSKVEDFGRTFITTTQREIRRQVQTGTPVNEILSGIKRRAEKMEDAALMAARAEIAAVNAVLSMERQVSAGIEEYIWRTRRDERVRDSHRAKEGTKQRWSKAPSDTGHPGHDYMCRCWAEPIKS